MSAWWHQRSIFWCLVVGLHFWSKDGSGANSPQWNERYGRRVQAPWSRSFVSMILLERGGKEDAILWKLCSWSIRFTFCFCACFFLLAWACFEGALLLQACTRVSKCPINFEKQTVTAWSEELRKLFNSWYRIELTNVQKSLLREHKPGTLALVSSWNLLFREY